METLLPQLTAFANEYYSVWVVGHLLSLVVGLGGATYTDILLVRFLKDYRIDAKEAEVIRTMSTAVTIGVFLALASGIMLFLTKPEVLLATPKFQAKMIIFAVIMLNGFLLHRIVLPKLLHFSFDADHYLVAKFLHLRHAGFIMGAISGVSWYSAFLLGALRTVPLSFATIMTTYGVLIVGGVIGSLCIEKVIQKCRDDDCDKG